MYKDGGGSSFLYNFANRLGWQNIFRIWKYRSDGGSLHHRSAWLCHVQIGIYGRQVRPETIIYSYRHYLSSIDTLIGNGHRTPRPQSNSTTIRRRLSHLYPIARIRFWVPRFISKNHDDQGMIGFTLMFANVGFIGYPIVSSIFGPKAIFMPLS